MLRIIFFAFIAAFSTFLFGYHTGIIAGALVYLTPDFTLTVFQQQLVVSALLLSACVGTLLGGWLADSIGRKKTLFISALFFFLGNFLLFEARELEMLLLGRFMIGLAIAIGVITAPLYISEISPPKIRGALVTMGQLMTAIGILVAYIIAFVFASQKDWRAMFNGGFIPLGLFFVGLFFIPESPLWLKQRGTERSQSRAKLSSPSLLKPMGMGMALS
ncbi:MAG TPA: MFS transporter, partial [Chlamydiales bacterium]|nr:MFS transporter [Chlamydiales bacterium]